jgi:hypothetical protein
MTLRELLLPYRTIRELKAEVERLRELIRPFDRDGDGAPGGSRPQRRRK